MKSLNIAIDASRTTRQQRTGTENYSLQLIRHLLALNSNHHFNLYFRDEPPSDLFTPHSNWSKHVIKFPRMWTQVRFAAELWRTRPDLTFVSAHTLPRFFPGRAVATVHDLGYLYFPEAHPEKERRYLDWSTKYSANRATIVLADAEATKHDLMTHYHIPEDKIWVVYPGYDESLASVADPEKLTAVRQKYNLPEQYLFFLGTLQPRKNIARLVEAYAQWRSSSGNQDIGLVLGGNPGWLYDESWTAGVDGVTLTGYVTDEDVAALYSGALAFVFPSLYEGFGFPVIEAMRCDTSVLCSSTTSLSEIGEDAVLQVDPLDIDSIAEGIRQLVDDENLRRNLVEKGRVQSEKFSWQRAAEITLQALEAAATI